MKVRYINLVILSLIFTLQSSSALAQYQDTGYRAGVINIESVTRNNDGSADVSYNGLQVFDGETGSYKTVGGSRAGNRYISSSIVSPTMYDLLSSPFYAISMEGGFNYTSAVLSCSEPEDICRGCTYASVSGPARTEDIVNADPSNSQYSLITRYSVASSQTYPAPNFNGENVFRIPNFDISEIDLRSAISANASYSCSLRSPSYRIGISENPEGLSVTEDCKINFDTTLGKTSVGEKYAVQMVIAYDESVNDCQAKTYVDLLFEIGCTNEEMEAGDPRCFLCSKVDQTPVKLSILSTLDQIDALTKKIANKAKRKARKISSDKTNLLRRQPIRAAKRRQVQHLAASTAIREMIAIEPDLVDTCASPSKIFCTSLDISTNQNILGVLTTDRKAKNNLVKPSRALTKTLAVALKRTGKSGSKAGRIKRKFRFLLQELFTRLNSEINALQKETIQCGF